MCHLSYQEKCETYIGLCQAKSIRFIAKELDRSPSTISREVRRNGDTIGYLRPADTKRVSKKRGFSKIDQNLQLKEYIMEKLNMHWSPGAIAGRWNLQTEDDDTITHESIYRWIYAPKQAQQRLYLLLPRRKKRRYMPRRRKTKILIPERVSIRHRPVAVNERKEFGHLEADLLFHSGSQQANVLSTIERCSRFVWLFKNASKRSAVVMRHLKTLCYNIDALKSMTFDNGGEFALHTQLKRENGIKTYFCRPGAPWQKGAIERLNGMVRRFIPFKLNAGSITQEMLNDVAYFFNHLPRKILNFKTPCEVFNDQSVNIRCCDLKLT